ncbi:glycerol-3-phosphate responsive antiterminator [Paenibacillus beijingensis]|uniref:Glycerol uptake operon antiterminator regulatory protein n=1 Tax=Paenibacillus beijingensis TaxID=1126833 RepID=A0A0D5NIH7_9BACL|nr:glycerol-3-phosphate responsive antiterminator [Paenibacillus beijingensis]AJY75164.1 glycerol-3-phosphate responsive antiterminator GlpP [Paenibacillus beijingensis]
MNDYPVIASITEERQVEKAAACGVRRVNLMTGTINNLGQIVGRLHDSGKQVFVHVEMVGGIGRDAAAIQYLANAFKIDGIITTKSNAVATAKQVGISSIQRVFAIDSAAVETALRMIKSCGPDEVELMPGLMPRIIREMKMKIKQPLIVGGLIRHDDEIKAALESGADYVSIGNDYFW